MRVMAWHQCVAVATPTIDQAAIIPARKINLVALHNYPVIIYIITMANDRLLLCVSGLSSQHTAFGQSRSHCHCLILI